MKKTFTFCLLILSFVSSFGQPCNWTQVVPGDCYRMISGDGGNLFVLRRLDVLKSTNDGVNWQNANWTLGIVRDSTSVFDGGTFSSFGSGQLIVAALDNGYWISSDTGNSFIQTGPTGFGCSSMDLMSLTNGRVIAAMSGFQRGIYKSEGANNDVWTNKFSGTDPNDFTSVNDDTLFSGTTNYLLQSTDSGETWNIMQNQWVVDVEIVDDSLYWIDNSGLGYVSHKNSVANPLPSSRFNLGPGIINDMKYDFSSNTIFATNIDSGVFISSDRGFNWTQCTIPSAIRYYNVSFYQGKVYVGTDVGLFSASLSTGIAENSETQAIILFPNPATEFLSIVSPMNGIQTFVIHDLFGRELKRWKFESNNSIQSISISELSSGIYYLSSSNSYKVKARKFVKQ